MPVPHNKGLIAIVFTKGFTQPVAVVSLKDTP